MICEEEFVSGQLSRQRGGEEWEEDAKVQISWQRAQKSNCPASASALCPRRASIEIFWVHGKCWPNLGHCRCAHSTPTQCVGLPVQRAPCQSSGQARDPPAVAHVRLHRRRLQFCGWRSRSACICCIPGFERKEDSPNWFICWSSRKHFGLRLSRYGLGGRMFTSALILDSLSEILSEVRWNRDYSLFVHGWR